MSWVRVTQVENIPVREGRSVKLGDTDVAIFNLGDGRFMAVENRCPHREGPLADGIVSGANVVCPLHGWKVCLDTGGVVKPKDQQGCVRTYPVRVENGIVLVRLPEEESAAA